MVAAVRDHIARLRLARGYDAVTARSLTDSLLTDAGGIGFFYRGKDDIAALAAGSARDELLRLANALLALGRQPNDKARVRGEYFALASEAFRVLGDKERAIAAAREGLPFVPGAVSEVNARGDEKPGPITNKREDAIYASGFGTEPVIALYRAGARDEALATDFLIAYERYKNADVAGETRDPLWIIEERSNHQLLVLRDLLKRRDVDGAARFYDGWRCAGPYGYDDLSDHYNSDLGLLAALAGRRGSMNAHFAIVLDLMDTGTWSRHSGDAVMELAVTWRRALAIAKTIGAKEDVFERPRCPVR
jgi:hypothetical protein